MLVYQRVYDMKSIWNMMELIGGIPTPEKYESQIGS